MKIDFNEQMKPLLVEKTRMIKRMQEMPAGKHPITNETIFREFPIYNINKNLDIIVDIQFNYSIMNENYKINQKYGFQYIIKEGYYWGNYYMFENNYDLRTVRLSGSWKNSK